MARVRCLKSGPQSRPGRVLEHTVRPAINVLKALDTCQIGVIIFIGLSIAPGISTTALLRTVQVMDPSAIGPLEWNEIGKMLTSLWIVVLFVVLFAANIIIGHNFIPSLVATQDIPRSFQRTRPAFYLLALVCFGVALFFLSEVVDFSGVLRRFWADYWI